MRQPAHSKLAHCPNDHDAFRGDKRSRLSIRPPRYNSGYRGHQRSECLAVRSRWVKLERGCFGLGVGPPHHQRRDLIRRGWIVSIGHTRANRGVLDEARNAGAHHMTNFMNAMTPLHHRDLGAVGWGLIHGDVTIDMIADGIHLDRKVLRLITKSKGVERVSLISDAIAAAGLGDGEYEIWGEKIGVTSGRTSNNRG